MPDYLFNKVVGMRPATLLKKRLWHRCFPVNFVKFLRTPIFVEHLWWLTLKNIRAMTRIYSWEILLLFRVLDNRNSRN